LWDLKKYLVQILVLYEAAFAAGEWEQEQKQVLEHPVDPRKWVHGYETSCDKATPFTISSLPRLPITETSMA
jgi:hypothetical protein